VTSDTFTTTDHAADPTWVSAPSAYHSAPVGETELVAKKPLHKNKVLWAGAAVVVLVTIAMVARSRRDKGESATGAAGARDRIAALARDRAGAYLAQAQNAVPSTWPTAVRHTLSSIPQSKKEPVRRAMSYACHMGQRAKARRMAR
jgi:hypothetical protein